MSHKSTLELNVEFCVQQEWTPDELCGLCRIEHRELVALVEEGVLRPRGGHESEWRFAADELPQARRAARLLRDLGVNAPGAALALQLLEELEALRAELRRHEG